MLAACWADASESELGIRRYPSQPVSNQPASDKLGAVHSGQRQEANWLPAPAGTFSLDIRACWGKQGILDGSWKPPVIRKV